MTKLVAAANAGPAEWLVAALTTFAELVLSLVPSGFAAYVRIFHPASQDGRRVRWAEIAEANGRRTHAGMQLPALTGDYRFLSVGQPAVFDQPPRVGSFPSELAEPLVDLLRPHTNTPETCWFAVWSGFGNTRGDIAAAPTFSLPGREYHLAAGSIEAFRDSASSGFGYQSSNIWWPDDRAWCVATEIDLNSTYVGCSEACSKALLSAPELEALRIDPSTGISWTRDRINSAPSRSS